MAEAIYTRKGLCLLKVPEVAKFSNEEVGGRGGWSGELRARPEQGEENSPQMAVF